MLVANFVSHDNDLSQTKTYEHMYKMLGAKPERLGIVASMYPQYTMSFILDQFMNVVERGNKQDKFTSISSLFFDFDIPTNYIKYVEFAALPVGDGANGSDITMYFTERYYERHDIFRIMESRQQCFVTERPIRKGDRLWEYTVRLIDNDYKSILDTRACRPGCKTRFQSNAQPELSREGYVKYQSNVSKYRNVIQTFRNDISWSSLYGATELVLINQDHIQVIVYCKSL